MNSNRRRLNTILNRSSNRLLKSYLVLRYKPCGEHLLYEKYCAIEIANPFRLDKPPQNIDCKRLNLTNGRRTRIKSYKKAEMKVTTKCLEAARTMRSPEVRKSTYCASRNTSTLTKNDLLTAKKLV